ncbi:Uncharacterised protein [Bordetella pertussis]|nr:Uncharacterised protein [Bordetella pertussis]
MVGGAAAQVGKHRAGTAHERGKARVARADEAPDQAKQDQAQRGQAEPDVPVHVQPAQLDGDQRADDGGRKGPMKQSRGQVPDANGGCGWLHGKTA